MVEQLCNQNCSVFGIKNSRFMKAPEAKGSISNCIQLLRDILF